MRASMGMVLTAAVLLLALIIASVAAVGVEPNGWQASLTGGPGHASPRSTGRMSAATGVSTPNQPAHAVARAN